MERRREERFDSEQWVRLTLLKEFGSPESVPAMMLDFSGNGLRLVSPLRIMAGAAVKVEVGDLLLFGEVIHAQRQEWAAKAHWTCGIRLEQGIFGLSALNRLMAALCPQDIVRPAEPGSDDPKASQTTEQGNRQDHPQRQK
jgi:hypothetical protein